MAAKVADHRDELTKAAFGLFIAGMLVRSTGEKWSARAGVALEEFGQTMVNRINGF